MDKTMQHFNQYHVESSLEWDGLKSSRFPKMRLMHANRDLIQTGIIYIYQRS